MNQLETVLHWPRNVPPHWELPLKQLAEKFIAKNVNFFRTEKQKSSTSLSVLLCNAQGTVRAQNAIVFRDMYLQCQFINARH